MTKENPESTLTGKSVSGINYTIEDLLPLREAMLLIGEILHVDGMQAMTLSRVAETWPMAGRDGVPALVCVELAAQTARVGVAVSDTVDGDYQYLKSFRPLDHEQRRSILDRASRIIAFQF